MAFAVIRLRSSRKKKNKIDDTLDMLRLNRINHCTIVPENTTYKGMLNKVKDLITWGELEEDVLLEMLKNRSDVSVEEMEKEIKDQTEYENIEEFAEAVSKDQVTIDEVDGLQNIFRMHPPQGGYKSIKRPYRNSGSLGYRGDAINELLMRMIGPDYDGEIIEEG